MADLMPDDSTTRTTSEAAPEAGVTTLDAEQVARFHEVAAGRLSVDVETAGALFKAVEDIAD